MDDSAERTRVEWRDWGPDAFDAADRAGKPVLLSLSATWCAHCHDMDRETYDDPRIAANVNDGFVPVRVDVDRHPRVRERYNMGGFPSTVFLTPTGRILSGAGYLGPDGFRDILTSVRTAWDAKGEDAGSVPRAIRDDAPPAGALTATIEKQMLGQLVDQFDADNGGWGDRPKFPLPRTVEFALKRDRDQARRTLDAIDAHLRDSYDGGFFRFAENPDWSEVHHEKLLDANAALVRAFANGYLATGDETYRAAAEQGVDYLASTLWTGDGFAGSQAAPGDEAYYQLDPSDRETAAAPSVDETLFADRNALAADALLTLAAYTDGDRARRYAERTLDLLETEFVRDDGAVVHHRPPVTDDEAPPETAEAPAADDEAPPETAEAPAAADVGILADQARVLGALVRAHQVTGRDTLDVATTVADWTIETLGVSVPAAAADADGTDPDAAVAAGDDPAAGLVFRDGPAEGAGLLSEALYDLDGNVEFADALLDLAVVLETARPNDADRSARYRRAGRQALAAFAGAADRFGVRVATYAATTSRYLESPLVVAVGDPAGSDLHRAALRLADHEKVVVPNAVGVDAGTASVRRGDTTHGSASTPAELADLVADAV